MSVNAGSRFRETPNPNNWNCLMPDDTTAVDRRYDRRERKQARARDILELRQRLGSPAPLALPHQAVFHWDSLDQVNALVEARDAEPELGFMMRLLALCTLPRTRPPSTQREYHRVNGPFTLYMNALGGAQLPFGTLPRLLLAWICSEAVRTQSRTLVLGRSLRDFMSKLGIKSNSGGARGDRTRLRNQMQRLFSANVTLIEEHRRGERAVSSNIVDRRELWWDPRGDQPVLWDSEIELGEKFYEEIIGCPVPIDMHILRAMKRSSLGLDLYLWLTYRMFTLKGPIKLTWRQVYRQFGPTNRSDKRTVDAFRTDSIRELLKLKDAWPQLNFRTPTGCLELRPSPPRIAPAPVKR